MLAGTGRLSQGFMMRYNVALTITEKMPKAATGFVTIIA